MGRNDAFITLLLELPARPGGGRLRRAGGLRAGRSGTPRQAGGPDRRRPAPAHLPGDRGPFRDPPGRRRLRGPRGRRAPRCGGRPGRLRHSGSSNAVGLPGHAPGARHAGSQLCRMPAPDRTAAGPAGQAQRKADDRTGRRSLDRGEPGRHAAVRARRGDPNPPGRRRRAPALGGRAGRAQGDQGRLRGPQPRPPLRDGAGGDRPGRAEDGRDLRRRRPPAGLDPQPASQLPAVPRPARGGPERNRRRAPCGQARPVDAAAGDAAAGRQGLARAGGNLGQRRRHPGVRRPPLHRRRGPARARLRPARQSRARS